MANHKSAAKRNRQRIKRTARNRSVRTRVRTTLKLAREAVAEKTGGAAELVAKATQMLDQAASKNIYPKKRVGRIKSRLVKQLNAISA